MSTRKKIAFVCQRYGLEVNGGSELYCRQVAEKLSTIFDVTVYTTCAIDYTNWANKYPPGIDEINGVRIKRYRVEKERNQGKFGRICQTVMRADHTDTQEEEWIDSQGPYCPELISALVMEHNEYCAVLFMTYLYYTTVRGITQNFDNAILIPTVHDEPWVYLHCYDKVFGCAKGIAWNTPEERAFARKRFPQILETPEVMTGIGVNVPNGMLPELPEKIQDRRYIVYAGRIDENKGCREMFDYFRQYRKNHSDNIKLVLIGKAVMNIPKDENIISLGYVSEEMKYAVMANSIALVLFSRYESLSMVVLESMMMGRPVLVTEHCEVLKGHCIRSNAGLYFQNYEEFQTALNYLLSHENVYHIMCENGKKYVDKYYLWNVIIDQYQKIISEIDANN